MRTFLFSTLASLIVAPAWGQTVIQCEGVRECTEDAPCVTEVVLQHNSEFIGAVTIYYTLNGKESLFNFPIQRSFESNPWVTLFDSGEDQRVLGDSWFALVPTPYGHWLGVLNWSELDAYSEMKCS